MLCGVFCYTRCISPYLGFGHCNLPALPGSYLLWVLVHGEYSPVSLQHSPPFGSPPSIMFRCGHNVKNMSAKKRYFVTFSMKCFTCSFINCFSRWVVYMIMCPCQKIHMLAKNKRELRKWIGEHDSSIVTEGDETSFAEHFKRYHGSSVMELEFHGIYQLKISNNRSDAVCLIVMGFCGQPI